MRENRTIPPSEIDRQKKIMEFVASKNKGLSKKAFVETYGCQQNVSDSETISGMLASMGYEMTDDKENADFIIYNTCAVRENAELKVYGNLGALKHLKKRKPDVILAVCGCMMQRESVKEEIRKKYKHIDIVFGTHSLYRFPEILSTVLNTKERVLDVEDSEGAIAEELPQKNADGPCAWVSVMYGCNNFCSYCIVPYVRGRERSRSKENIIEDVKRAAQRGCREVTLLGQNVNSYGNDLSEDIDFADLLSLVCKVDGIERVRFMTSHPKDISDKLVDTMAKEKKVCKQLHLPIQAGNNRVLESMNRRYTKESYLEKIRKIKEKMPQITLTTDIIVGFPGETNEEFEDTLEVLQKVRYDTIFSFIYSKRPGTPASEMEDVISPEEKKANFDKMLKLQETISKEKNLELYGKVMTVLVEGKSKTNPEYLSGRTEGGKIVNFKGDESITGTFKEVEITDVKTWSLTGKLID